MESCKGTQKEVSVSVMETCGECGGNGCAKGSSPITCGECGGTGQVRVQQRTPFGVMTSTRTCSRCNGTGKLIKNPCSKCSGSGRVRKSKKLMVDIPAGIEDGQTIAIRGKGDAGLNGGPAGDLNITVSVRPDPIFKPVSYTHLAQAVCDSGYNPIYNGCFTFSFINLFGKNCIETSF